MTKHPNAGKDVELLELRTLLAGVSDGKTALESWLALAYDRQFHI